MSEEHLDKSAKKLSGNPKTDPPEISSGKGVNRIMKINRRSLLIAGLGAGAAITGTQEQLRLQALQAQEGLRSPAEETLRDHLSIMSAAYSSEEGWEAEVASGAPVPPAEAR